MVLASYLEKDIAALRRQIPVLINVLSRRYRQRLCTLLYIAVNNFKSALTIMFIDRL